MRNGIYLRCLKLYTFLSYFFGTGIVSSMEPIVCMPILYFCLPFSNVMAISFLFEFWNVAVNGLTKNVKSEIFCYSRVCAFLTYISYKILCYCYC